MLTVNSKIIQHRSKRDTENLFFGQNRIELVAVELWSPCSHITFFLLDSNIDTILQLIQTPWERFQEVRI